MILFVVACASNEDEKTEVFDDKVTETSIDTSSVITETPQDSSNVTDVYSSSSIFTEGVGWGYQILLNDKPYISQPHIPAISGVKGFETEEDALKTAALGIYKMNNGLFPPTISEAELDSLGVLH